MSSPRIPLRTPANHGLFEDTDTITLNIRLFDTDGRGLINSEPGSMPLWAPYICRIPEITVERRFPLAEWRAAIIDHAVAMSNDITSASTGRIPT